MDVVANAVVALQLTIVEKKRHDEPALLDAKELIQIEKVLHIDIAPSHPLRLQYQSVTFSCLLLCE